MEKRKNNQSEMSLSGGYGVTREITILQAEQAGGYCMIKQNYGKENNNR
jgi:hypothetical protein